MPWPENMTLDGEHCTLIPLHLDHLNPLIEAVSDGELWNLKHTLVPHPNSMEKEINKRLMLYDSSSGMASHKNSSSIFIRRKICVKF